MTIKWREKLQKYEAYVQFTAGGRRVTKSKTAKKYKDAQKLEAELRLKYMDWDGEDPAFRIVADQWLEDVTPRVARATARIYEGKLKLLNPEIGHIPITALKRRDIRQIFSKRQRLSTKTLKLYKAVISCVLEYAVEMEYIEYNIAHRLKIQHGQPSKKRVAFSPDELQYIYNMPDHNPKDLLLLSLYTGLRIGEACGLRVRDVFLKDGYICVAGAIRGNSRANSRWEPTTKTEAGQRVVPFIGPAKDFIKHLLLKKKEFTLAFMGAADEQLIIADRGAHIGRYVLPSVIASHFHRVNKKNGTAITHHRARHTFATELHRQGYDAKTRAAILGHTSSVISDDIYTHLSTQDLIRKVRENEIAGLAQDDNSRKSKNP